MHKLFIFVNICFFFPPHPPSTSVPHINTYYGSLFNFIISKLFHSLWFFFLLVDRLQWVLIIKFQRWNRAFEGFVVVEMLKMWAFLLAGLYCCMSAPFLFAFFMLKDFTSDVKIPRPLTFQSNKSLWRMTLWLCFWMCRLYTISKHRAIHFSVLVVRNINKFICMGISLCFWSYTSSRWPYRTPQLSFIFFWLCFFVLIAI